MTGDELQEGYDAWDRDVERRASERLPESKAAERLAAAIGVHLQPKWLTTVALEEVCKKLVAHRPFVRSVLDDLDADPKRLPERDVVLSQDYSAPLEDSAWWDEHCGHLKRELDDALAIRARVKAAHAPQLVDRDAIGADEDSDRISQERRDDEAAAGMPRVAS